MLIQHRINLPYHPTKLTPGITQQPPGVALLHNLPILKINNPIGLYRRQRIQTRQQNCRFRHLLKRQLTDEIPLFNTDCGGHKVTHEDFGFGEDGAGDVDELLVAQADVAAGVLYSEVKLGLGLVEADRLFGWDLLPQADFYQGFTDLLVGVLFEWVDVLAQGGAQDERVRVQ